MTKKHEKEGKNLKETTDIHQPSCSHLSKDSAFQPSYFIVQILIFYLLSQFSAVLRFSFAWSSFPHL